MDNAIVTTIISTSGAVIVGVAGMWISANQMGKRLDDFGKRLDDFGRRLDRLADSLDSQHSIWRSPASSTG